MRVVRWIWKHAYLILLIVVGFVGFIATASFMSSRKSPLDLARRERDAIDKGEKARLLELKRGREEANAAADLEYRETINAMDDRQRTKADKLRRDPARRARYLARVSRQLPTDPF